jgi:hypothetical protein
MKRLAILLLAAIAGGLLLAVPASAHSGPTAAVEMGDSYISGEGGRWLGNSVDAAGNRDGTDRACSPSISRCTSYDPAKVYVGGSAADGCHRADVAEIDSASLPVQDRVNIACSGAVSSDLYRSADGGTRAHGEPPEADQLLQVARTHDVRFIVVSIGGNDLGFASLVAACFEAYESHGTPCSQSQASALDPQALATAQAKVEKAIDEIRATMRTAGYRDGDYRLALQTYPVVVPHARDDRYAQSDPRRTSNGCPFYDVDLDWAQDVAAPRIAAMVKAAAASRRVPVLDLLRAFTGHEICAKTDSSVTPLDPPSASGSEWGRALSPSAIAEGQEQEVFHPDAFGHLAMGNCLSRFSAAPVANYACTGAAGITPRQERLTKVSDLPQRAAHRRAACRLLRVRARRHHRIAARVRCRRHVHVTVAARRHGHRVARHRKPVRRGTHTVHLRLPRHVHGRVRVTVTVRDRAGHRQRFHRHVRVSR